MERISAWGELDVECSLLTSTQVQWQREYFHGCPSGKELPKGWSLNIFGLVTEPMVPDLRLLSSAHLCAFPVIPPLFSLNCLFRPNEANISYVYLLVYLSLYNTLIFTSWSRSSFSLSPLISHLKTPGGSE